MSSDLAEKPRDLNARQIETLDKLLTAGLHEVRAVGHEALTIRTVAQRAGVSPATAYTYLASKNHLFAELFWRHLADDLSSRGLVRGSQTTRAQSAMRALIARIVEEPELAAAVTPALLDVDSEVDRLRLMIGGELYARIEAALLDPDEPDEPVDAAVLEALVLALSGALLQAGMGLMTYDEMADRMATTAAVIIRGNE